MQHIYTSRKTSSRDDDNNDDGDAAVATGYDNVDVEKDDDYVHEVETVDNDNMIFPCTVVLKNDS